MKVNLSAIAAALAALLIVGLAMLGLAYAKTSQEPNDASARTSPFIPIPDQQKTPGEWDASMTKQDMCTPALSTEPAISPATAKAVFALYGIHAAFQAEWKLVFALSCTLGGRNTVKNVFPIPNDSPYTPAMLAELNRKLRMDLCSSSVTLKDLNQLRSNLAMNWVAKRIQVLGSPFPKVAP